MLLIISIVTAAFMFAKFRELPFYQYHIVAFIIIFSHQVTVNYQIRSDFIYVSSFCVLMDLLMIILGLPNILSNLKNLKLDTFKYLFQQKTLYFFPKFIMPDHIKIKQENMIREINQETYNKVK